MPTTDGSPARGPGCRAAHGGEAMLSRRTERRMGTGSSQDLRDREAAMLVDPAGALPGLSTSWPGVLMGDPRCRDRPGGRGLLR